MSLTELINAALLKGTKYPGALFELSWNPEGFKQIDGPRKGWSAGWWFYEEKLYGGTIPRAQHVEYGVSPHEALCNLLGYEVTS